MNSELILELIKMAISDKEPKPQSPQDGVDKGRYIVIGNRGNVVVGDLVIRGGTGYLSNASVIRRWGTTKGLGQLALEGKQGATVLDECGDFEFELLTTCGMIPVKSDL